jgi:hypothetical protein
MPNLRNCLKIVPRERTARRLRAAEDISDACFAFIKSNVPLELVGVVGADAVEQIVDSGPLQQKPLAESC